MAISIDASGVAAPGAFTSTASTALTVSTTTANDLIIVIVGYNSASGTHNVSSITSAHLSFSKYTQQKHGTSDNTIEVWTARASGTLSSEAITITFDSTVSIGFAVGFGVVGLGPSFIDPNVSLPAALANVSIGGPAAATYSTTGSDDIIFGLCNANVNSSTVGTPTAGFSTLVSDHTTGSATLFVDYRVVAAPQTSQSYNRTGTVSGSAGAWQTVVFAFTTPSSVSVNLTGVHATGAARALAVHNSIAFALTGVHATGHARSIAPGHDTTITLAHVSATGIARQVPNLAGAFLAHVHATGRAGSMNYVNVLLVGVRAYGAALPIGVQIAPPIPYYPLFTLMRDTPVALSGAMSNDPVLGIGTLFPSACPPVSVAQPLVGVRATGRAATITPFFNVRVNLIGVRAQSRAGMVLGIGNVF